MTVTCLLIPFARGKMRWNMCDKCKRCWFDNCSGLYICGFWSGDELVAIDSVPSESFEENGTCNFFEE